METIIKILKKIHMYNWAVKVVTNHRIRKNLTKNYKFEDRRKNKEKLCIILSGYKEFLFDVYFKRLKMFLPDDVEVCLCSSGKYSEKLSNIAKENDWSYLSTKRNNVSLIQNVAIKLFENAEYIYKIDEDIMITDGFFKTLYETLKDCEKNGEYKPGFIAPTIPINGFSNMLILKRFDLIDTYTKLFERPIYAAGRDRMVENNPEAAKFFWGKDGYLPSIDEMNAIVQKDNFEYVACPIRFSIGAILFTRKFYEEMGMFHVFHGAGMGGDETQICEYCMSSSHAIIVSKNTIVGHLSFSEQNKEMKKYFETHQEVFDNETKSKEKKLV